jgi:hypothetical protein
MSEKPTDGQKATGDAAKPAKRRPYEKPRVVWREAYEPVAFGISCAKQPGVSQCQGGPGTT